MGGCHRFDAQGKQQGAKGQPCLVLHHRCKGDEKLLFNSKLVSMLASQFFEVGHLADAVPPYDRPKSDP
ncbi:hypothetical protein NDU88_002291 [Pleurodeles waltl]|uniref:Uncharacterized protein n=1 Tax=Pleurodeles waltl TaxID=8319 RepID=A0AAV7UBX9_PLEWA|nr:hypothetical protein NDU88_002291 [Pleurodeles waltl]